MSKLLLTINSLYKCYNDLKIIDDISFELAVAEKIGLAGRSGSGKTTLLRILAAFEKPTSGKIIFSDKQLKRPTPRIMMVHQDFNQLLPWKTALDNIIYPAVTTGRLKHEDACKNAKELLLAIELIDFSDRYPHELSGGMRQRIAVARALIMTPDILLMDEPFGALDNTTRAKMQKVTCEVCKMHNIAMVLSTHSINEVINMTDRILVLCGNGKAKIVNNDFDADEKIKKLITNS